jgi:dTDP-4-dehydrorhamnose reductase
MSSPRQCHEDHSLALAANDCSTLCEAIKSICPQCLFILISTDLVYKGDNAPYTASDDLSLLEDSANMYAYTKQEAERNVIQLERSVILRCSNMIYPGRGKFYDFLFDAMMNHKVCGLRVDEYRSFVSTLDVVTVIGKTIEKFGTSTTFASMETRVLNVGGRKGLSRLELGMMMAATHDVEVKLFHNEQAAEQDGSSSTWRIYKQYNAECNQSSPIHNPANVTMNIEDTESILDFQFMPLHKMLVSFIGDSFIVDPALN